MANDNVYLDIQASLLNFCMRLIQDNPVIFAGFEVFDFDSHASVNELPKAHLLGISEFSVTNLDKHYYVTAMITIATKTDDAQLKVLRPAINEVFSLVEPGYNGLTVVDSKIAGTVRGNLTVMDNVAVLPVGRHDNRPVQMIAVHLGSSFLTPP